MQFIDLKKQYKEIKENVDTAMDKVLTHGQYIMGPEVKMLEEELCKYTQAKHCIACANGTDALSLSLMALGIKEGDEIISTPFTFFATGETVALSGAKLVFADIDPRTYNIDADKIESLITEKTKAIIPVSLYGQMPDLEKIMQIAKKHNLRVIEDAAQSFGAEYHGKKSCSIADISTTSFFPAKPLGCYGDGGAVFTNDDQLAIKLRQLANHGQAKRYTHTSIGLNSRLDTLQAAVLLEKIKIFPSEVLMRQKVAKRYDELFGNDIKKIELASGCTSVYAQYTIEVKNREKFLGLMKDKGIPTAVHYPIQIHEQPIFKELGYDNIETPLSKKASESVVSLPMHPYLSEEDQDKVVRAVKESLKEL